MRVTKNMIISSFMDSLAKAEERNMRNQRRISTGLEVEKPSDNPADASRILFLRSKVANTEQQQKNVDHISNWTTQTASILQNGFETFLRAQDLAQRGATETTNQDQRDDLAQEVNELLEGLTRLANEKIENYYAFGGNYIDGEPYIITRDASGEIDTVTLDAQTGINGKRIEEVLDGRTETVNELGSDIFTTTGGLDLFEVLKDLRDNLRAGDTDLISGSLSEVKSAIQHINVNIDKVGSKEEWLAAVKTRLEEAALHYDTQKAGYEEADLVQAIMALQNDQNAYQAALQAGASSVQLSLMDFLR